MFSKMKQLLGDISPENLTLEQFVDCFQNDVYLNNLLQKHNLSYEQVIKHLVETPEIFPEDFLSFPTFIRSGIGVSSFPNALKEKLGTLADMRIVWKIFETKVKRGSMRRSVFSMLSKNKKKLLKKYAADKKFFFLMLNKVEQLIDHAGLTCLVLFPELRVDQSDHIL